MILDIVDIIEWITNIPGNLKIILEDCTTRWF